MANDDKSDFFPNGSWAYLKAMLTCFCNQKFKNVNQRTRWVNCQGVKSRNLFTNVNFKSNCAYRLFAKQTLQLELFYCQDNYFNLSLLEKRGRIEGIVQVTKCPEIVEVCQFKPQTFLKSQIARREWPELCFIYW